MSEELQNVSNETNDQNVNSENVNAGAVFASAEGTVEYDGGSGKNPMKDLAEEYEKEQSQEITTNNEDDGLAEEKAKDIIIEAEEEAKDEELNNSESKKESIEDPSKIIELEEGELPIIEKSERPGFDPDGKQDARVDNKIEGGVVNPRSTGQMKERINDASQEGSQVKTPDIDVDSIKNKYEVTGFTIEYSDGDYIKTKDVRDYFDDIETAQASINRDKYLMPTKSGYKVSTIISGAPIICYNERQNYNYINGKWSRTF